MASSCTVDGSPAARSASRPAARSPTLTMSPAVRPVARTSSTRPEAMHRPPDRMATRSQICCTSPSRWLERNTVRPSSPSRRSRSRTSFRPAGSRPLAGSSRIRTAGSLSSAAASPRRCFIPSEYVFTRSAALVPSPTWSRTSSTRRRPTLCSRPSSSRFLRPEKPGNIAGVSTIDPTRRETEASSARDDAPSSLVVPAVGEISPRRHRMVVVLPEPLGPRNPNTPPSGTSRSRPATASVGWPRTRRYSFRSALTSMMPIKRARREGTPRPPRGRRRAAR